MQVRYAALDGWRGLAALAIAFYHVPIDHMFRDWSNWKNMEIFVDLFFVLSGFVIAHAWRDRLTGIEAAKTFLHRRFWRVWPLHIFVLAIFFAIECMKWGASLFAAQSLENPPFSGYTSIPSLFSNIFLVQSLGLHGSTTWNSPAWSISVEFWVYVVFAATLLVFRKYALWAFVSLSALGCVGLALFSKIGLLATYDYGLFRGLFGFFAGVITHAIVVSLGERKRNGVLAELVVIAVLIAFLALTGRDRMSLFGPVIFAVLVGIFATSNGPVTRFFEGAMMQKLGLWSYSIYMIHVLLFYLLRMGLIAVEKLFKIPLTESGAGGDRLFSTGFAGLDAFAIVVLIGIAVALSGLSYRSLEKPFMAGASARTPDPTG